MPAQEKPCQKSQGELIVHEEERQKAIRDILQSLEKVKAFAMGTENIRVLQFVKERLDQAIEPGYVHDTSSRAKIARRETAKRYYEKNKTQIISKMKAKRRKVREADVGKFEVPAGIQVI